MPDIRTYMTPATIDIEENATCHEAHAVMRRFHVRHLPVVRGTRVVGIVSLPALHYSLANHDDANRTPVSAVMEPAIVVSGDTSVAAVARRMIDQKLGAVLVVDGDQRGIFTTVDALYAIVNLSENVTTVRPKRRPGESIIPS
jgi:CBS domain-containing protein